MTDLDQKIIYFINLITHNRQQALPHRQEIIRLDDERQELERNIDKLIKLKFVNHYDGENIIEYIKKPESIFFMN